MIQSLFLAILFLVISVLIGFRKSLLLFLILFIGYIGMIASGLIYPGIGIIDGSDLRQIESEIKDIRGDRYRTIDKLVVAADFLFGSDGGVKSLRQLAKEGSATAQYVVGLAEFYGYGSGNKNHDKAAEWFKKSSAQGNRRSHEALAVMYCYGLGITKNLAASKHYFKKAGQILTIKILRNVCNDSIIEFRKEVAKSVDKYISVCNYNDNSGFVYCFFDLIRVRKLNELIEAIISLHGCYYESPKPIHNYYPPKPVPRPNKNCPKPSS